MPRNGSGRPWRTRWPGWACRRRKPRPADFSGLYLAYRPALTGDPDAALDATERLIAELRDSGARIPGEASRARRERCLADGQVDVDQQALDLLDPIVPP